ncbi:MAG TPA: hypothetical protein VGO58_06530 [Chitinophagaceae bacterium]|jgi:hypothetical protein|nr:hypothetical protein [Chitinophagaceae bacterium]
MKKVFIILAVLAGGLQTFAQVEVVQFLPRNEDKFGIGFGAALKFGIPVSEAASATFEGSIVYAPISESGWTQGIVMVPIKLGYLYTLNGSGRGFYVEPQAGYCIYGAFTNDLIDEKIKGFVWAIGTGYLFSPGRRTQYGIGLRYETIHFKNGGPQSFIALRLSSSLSFGRRE